VVRFPAGTKDFSLQNFHTGRGAHAVFFLGAFTKLQKKKSDYYLRHVCPSVRMEQLGSHWTDFHEI
jgi:hypothetical protein